MSAYINVIYFSSIGGGGGGGGGHDLSFQNCVTQSTMRGGDFTLADGQESKLSEGHRHFAFAHPVCDVRLCQSRNLTIASKA